MTENVEKIMSFAPGEGNRPLGIFMDKESEFLSLPSISCGETRADKHLSITAQYANGN